MTYNDLLLLTQVNAGLIQQEDLLQEAIKASSPEEFENSTDEEILSRFMAKLIINGNLFANAIPDERKVETKIPSGFDLEMTVRDKTIRLVNATKNLDIFVRENLTKRPIVLDPKSGLSGKIVTESMDCKINNLECAACYEECTSERLLYHCPYCKTNFCLECVLKNIFLDPASPNFLCLGEGCQKELILSKLIYLIDQQNPTKENSDAIKEIYSYSTNAKSQSTDFARQVEILNSHELKKKLVNCFLSKYTIALKDQKYALFKHYLDAIVEEVTTSNVDLVFLTEALSPNIAIAIRELIGRLFNLFPVLSKISEDNLFSIYLTYITSDALSSLGVVRLNAEGVKVIKSSEIYQVFRLYMLLVYLEHGKLNSPFVRSKPSPEESKINEELSNPFDETPVNRVLGKFVNFMDRHNNNVSMEFFKTIKEIVCYRVLSKSKINSLNSFISSSELKDKVVEFRRSYKVEYAGYTNSLILVKDILNGANHAIRKLLDYVLTKVSSASKVKFIGRCPIEGCLGSINEHYVCNLCSKKICKECYHEETEGHVCDPNHVEDYKYILRETKACPWCYARVSKTTGCDDMFCYKCKKMFNWVTLEKYYSPRHNPERARWLESNRETDANPEILDVDEDDIRIKLFNTNISSSTNHILGDNLKSSLLASDIMSFIVKYNLIHESFLDTMKEYKRVIQVEEMKVRYAKERNIQFIPYIKESEEIFNAFFSIIPLYKIDGFDTKKASYEVIFRRDFVNYKCRDPLAAAKERYNFLMEVEKTFLATKDDLIREIKWLHIAHLRDSKLNSDVFIKENKYSYHLASLYETFSVNFLSILKIKQQ